MVKRVIQFELNPNREQKIILDSLTYAASKLWNIANYERKSRTKESGSPYAKEVTKKLPGRKIENTGACT